MPRRSAAVRNWSVRTRLLTLFGIIGTMTLAAGSAPAPPSVTLTVDTASHGYAIPPDFAGLSFETGSERLNNAGVSGYLFSPSDTQLVTLFQNLGIGSLRMGGGSVDDEIPPGMGSDGYTGIDDLFGFAQLTGTQVIYSLRLLDPSRRPIPDLAAHDAAIAQHIAQRYGPNLTAFAIGNEPDWNSYHHSDPLITNYPTYLADWRNFAHTILASVPDARFVGPDTGAYTTATYYNGQSWTQRFAEDASGSGPVVLITQHDYVGAGPKTTTAQQAIDDMLSAAWEGGTSIATGPEGPSTYTPNPWLYQHNLAPVLAQGLPYRMTEANDYLGGVAGASNAFASALWTLDYMHWWAEHGAAGVNFHNKQWILTDTIVPTPNPCAKVCRNWQTAPKGYGIKAFNLGGHGFVEPVTISNPGGVNLTAYAVGAGRTLYVTVINKTQGQTPGTQVNIVPKGFPAASAAEMVLTDGVPGDAGRPDASLGGAAITNASRWLGQWTPLPPEIGGRLTLTVPPATAVVVKVEAAGADAGPVRMEQRGALDVLASGTDGQVWHDTQTAAGVPSGSPSAWSGWATLPLPSGLQAAATPTVVRNLDGTLEAFVATTAGDVYHNGELTPGGQFGGWQDLGGGRISDLVAATNADGSLAVFGIGPNRDIWEDTQSAPGVGWSGWTDLGGQPLEPGFTVGQSLSGLLQVFAVDSAGRVWSDAQTDPGTWGGWHPLAAGGHVPPLGPQLAVGRDLDGTLELFGIDRGGTVWRAWQTAPGGAWQGWSALGGGRIAPGFAVGMDGAGRLTLFGVRAGGPGTPPVPQAKGSAPGTVVSIAQRTPGGAWGRWTDLGGTVVQPTVAVGTTADGRLQIFASGANGDVWSRWQEVSGGWSAWTDFGGKGLGFSALG